MAVFTNQASLSYGGRTALSNVTVGRLTETLTLTKTALQSGYCPGDRLTYTVSLVNTGTTALTGLTLTDDLGAYAFGEQTLVPLTAEDGSLQVYLNGVLQEEAAVTYGPALTVVLPDLPAGGSLLLVYAVTVNGYAPPGEGGTVTNTVTAAGDGLAVPVTAETTVTAETAAALSVAKALSPAEAAPGEEITYTFTLENSGTAALTAEDAAVLTDTFAPALTGLSAAFNGTAWTAPTNYSYAEATGLFTTAAGQLTVPAAACTQDADSGLWTVTPGTATLTVTGTIG